jgi:lipoic acid synthetase
MSDAITKQKGAAKTARAFGKATIPIVPAERLKKPDWIRVRMGDSRRFQEIKAVLRSHQLHTVCEEASCPNISECFRQGHRDLHDPGRLVHAPLPVLRRCARPAASTR